MCAGIVSKPRIVPEWCFIHLIQNIKQIKSVFDSPPEMFGIPEIVRGKGKAD
jgi:hypothetical protein